MCTKKQQLQIIRRSVTMSVPCKDISGCDPQVPGHDGAGKRRLAPQLSSPCSCSRCKWSCFGEQAGGDGRGGRLWNWQASVFNIFVTTITFGNATGTQNILDDKHYVEYFNEYHLNLQPINPRGLPNNMLGLNGQRKYQCKMCPQV